MLVAAAAAAGCAASATPAQNKTSAFADFVPRPGRSMITYVSVEGVNWGSPWTGRGKEGEKGEPHHPRHHHLYQHYRRRKERKEAMEGRK